MNAWFPDYPTDWLAQVRRLGLSLEEQGMLRQLQCECLDAGKLHGNLREIRQRISPIPTKKRFEKLIEKLGAELQSVPGGFVFTDLIQRIEKSNEIREKRRLAALKMWSDARARAASEPDAHAEASAEAHADAHGHAERLYTRADPVPVPEPDPSSSLRSEEAAPSPFKLQRERAQPGKQPRRIAPESPEAFRVWFTAEHERIRGALLGGELRQELGQIKGLLDDLTERVGADAYRQAQRMATAMLTGDWPPGKGSRGIGLLVSLKCRQKWFDAAIEEDEEDDGGGWTMPRDCHGNLPPDPVGPMPNPTTGKLEFWHIDDIGEWCRRPGEPKWMRSRQGPNEIPFYNSRRPA